MTHSYLPSSHYSDGDAGRFAGFRTIRSIARFWGVRQAWRPCSLVVSAEFVLMSFEILTTLSSWLFLWVKDSSSVQPARDANPASSSNPPRVEAAANLQQVEQNLLDEVGWLDVQYQFNDRGDLHLCEIIAFQIVKPMLRCVWIPVGSRREGNITGKEFYEQVREFWWRGNRSKLALLGCPL